MRELAAWKARANRRPLLLRGARQVGKSYLVEQFGKKCFDNLVTADFERHPDLASCFKSRDPITILKQLELMLEAPIRPGTTLLFLDEIQACPDALVSLRYFWELMPELHVIAAGSLMEFLLHDDRYSFPVGRIEFLYLHPMSFLEYLAAAAPIAHERVTAATLGRPLTEVEHNELLKWLRRYLFIGGMPAAVQSSLEQDSLLEVQRMHRLILQAYASDFGKYASRIQEHRYLPIVFGRVPVLVGNRLKYSAIDPDVEARSLKPALELLGHAGLIQRAYATTGSGLPLHAHMRERQMKLYYLDVGLLQTACHVDAQEFFDGDILQINRGKLAEQLVAQELISSALPDQNAPLLFWETETGGQAEVDFVVSAGTKIVPLEVKAGSLGSIRSLRSFMQTKTIPLGVRIADMPLSLHGDLLTVPLYLAGEWERLTLEAYEMMRTS